MISGVAGKTHKAILPRVTDAIHSALGLLARCEQGEHLTMFIVDLVDAFWTVPLHLNEGVSL